METDELKYQDNIDQDNIDKGPEEEVETIENIDDFDQLNHETDEDGEESKETETVEGYVEGSPEPIPVEFTLLTETVDFDTPLNDLGFASVAICISLFVTFMVVAWRFDK